MDQGALYQLTPFEFEQLAGRLLASEGMGKVAYADGSTDPSVDLVGEQNGEIIAVEVKHRKRPLSVDELWRIVDKLKSSIYNPSRLVLVTSAKVPDSTKPYFRQSDQTACLCVIDRDEVLRILSADVGLQEGPIANAEKRTRRLTLEFWAGLIAVISSIGGVVTSSMSLILRPTSLPLTQRIEAVESAIGNLKNLENELIGLKREIIQTERTAGLTKKEYEDAKQLQQLTDKQFAAVRSALEKSSWQKSLLDSALGGVAPILWTGLTPPSTSS